MKLNKKILFVFVSLFLLFFIVSCDVESTKKDIEVNFVADNYTTVTVYATDELEGGVVTKKANPKDSKTGTLLNDGNGSVYFSIKISEGYEFSKFEGDQSKYDEIVKVENNKDLIAYVIKGVKKDLSLTIVTSKIDVTEPEEGFKVSFVVDDNVVVTVYDTKEYEDGKEALTAFARDSETGEIDISGDGQVNFIVTTKEGYEIANVIATPTSNYKNLKLPEELGVGTYRVTKISGEVTVTITSKEEGSIIEDEGFEVTFVVDDNVVVTVYDTQDYIDGKEVLTAIARNSETGAIDISGDGQVNFIVTAKEGYEIANVIATPTSNYKNLKLPEELGVGTYRVTKITGEVTVTITSKEEGSITEEEFVGTFILDDKVIVTIYHTQDYIDGEVTNTAIARNSETGEKDISGNGQINFIVTVLEGYEIESIAITPKGNYKNLKLPDELGENTYRITKISGDITITIVTKPIE